MRSMLLLGCVVAASAGCKTMQSQTSCSPCHSGACPAPAGGAAPAPAGKPAVLPPTIREVRGNVEEPADPRQASASVPNLNQDVLLIPRWVYVPYAPHTPNGPSKLPGTMAGTPAMNPYMAADDRTADKNTEMMEQCLREIRALNQRMSDLESRNSAKPASAVMPAAPPVIYSTPVPLPPLPTPVIPPAK
jgi:hypothetical protein